MVWFWRQAIDLPQMTISSAASAASGHFRVTQKAAESLGLTVLNVLQHVVVVKTARGPRFVSRKRCFDRFELDQRRQRAMGCLAQSTGANTWLVFDPSTKSDHQTVIKSGQGVKGAQYFSCTCADAHFQHERGIPAGEILCKHILAVSEFAFA